MKNKKHISYYDKIKSILKEHDLIETDQLLSEFNKVRYKSLNCIPALYDVFSLLPLLFCLTLFTFSLPFLEGNYILFGFQLFILTATLFFTAYQIRTGRPKRQKFYNRHFARLIMFLKNNAENKECMTKAIQLARHTHRKETIKLFAPDPYRRDMEEIDLPEIKKHEILDFIFFDLFIKNKKKYPHHISNQLFLQEEDDDNSIKDMFSNVTTVSEIDILQKAWLEDIKQKQKNGGLSLEKLATSLIKSPPEIGLHLLAPSIKSTTIAVKKRDEVMSVLTLFNFLSYECDKSLSEIVNDFNEVFLECIGEDNCEAVTIHMINSKINDLYKKHNITGFSAAFPSSDSGELLDSETMKKKHKASQKAYKATMEQFIMNYL